MFPGIFNLIREQRPQAKTAVVYSWDDIGYIVEKEAIDYVVPTNGNKDGTLDSAIEIIKMHKPLLTFVHFDQPDGIGHKEGQGNNGNFYHTLV